MISVEEAQKQIFERVKTTSETYVDINDSSEVVIRETLFADRNFPPFHRICMDGIAFSIIDWKRGCRCFSIEGCHNAGDSSKTLTTTNGCFEVMTGAILPQGCDVVVPYEEVTISDAKAYLSKESRVALMQNIHQEGSDYKKGDLLVSEGTVMRSPQWSIAASIGKKQLRTSKKHKIAVISTGNELVDVEIKPEAFQIRRSNSYALISCLHNAGFHDAVTFHLMDHRDTMRQQLGEIINQFDVIIISGGVSMGKLDLIPQVLNDLSVTQVFHKVKQRPGKPFWFGLGPREQMIFGLPGNPVSTLVCFHRYVLPALRLSLGKVPSHNQPFALLKETVEFKLQFTYFLPVQIDYSQNGTLLATPVRVNGSGDFATLSKSHGFVELPASKEIYHRETAYPFWNWM